jgi:threonine dehydratase
MPPVTRSSIESAALRIEPYIRSTPVLRLGDVFDAGYELTLKLEHLQVTGSFKPRGAFSLLTASSIPDAGVVAASGGNFGLAVAYACARLGLPSTIFVPESSPSEKIERIGEQGAEVEVIDGFYDEAHAEASRKVEELGALEAHAYDQAEIVAGQGTLGRELEDQAQDVDTILVAVGGGGLIGGIATWFQGERLVVAVEPELCPGFHAARQAGHPVETEVGGIAVSSLGARKIGDLAWEASPWIGDSVLVTDEAIIEAQRWLWENTRLVVEPAGATPLAALMTGCYVPDDDARVAVVLSGGNTSPSSVE